MTDSRDRLLRELHLPTVLAQAQTVAIEAERSGWSFTRYLYTLVELELEQRRQHRIQRRRQQSGLPSGKMLTTLQLAHLPTPVRRQLPTLCEGQFVEQAQNVLAFGLPGRGKTHVLCAVGHALVERGYRVLFAPAYPLVQRLLAAKQALRLEQELHQLDGFAAIILDDMGYIQQSRAEMEVFFTFLAERYERKSVLISSHLVFSPWERIFQDPMTTAAAIDRLVHHAIILELTGSSFRTEQAQGRQPPAALTERDPSMERDTPSHHLAPETVTELGGHSANVKE